MMSSKLHDYFAGNCTEEEMLSIKEWVESSNENLQIFQKERVLYDILTLHDDEIKENKIKRNLPARKVYLSLSKIASAVIVLLLTSYFSMQFTREELSNNIQEINVPAGQYINVKLPDGSNVWLNAQTSLKYSPVFSHNKRHVELEGEAYFQVKNQNGLPFEVETSKGIIKVLGTEFNVKAHSKTNEFSTALINGSVEVNLKGESEKTLLVPGTSATLRKGALEVDQIQNYDDFSWKEGLITFNDASFDMIIRKFEEVFGYKMIIIGSETNGHKYTGKFRIDDGVDYALRVLRRSYSFQLERVNDGNTIYIKPISNRQ